MKKKSLTITWRRAAGMFYLLFCLLQMVLMSFVIGQVPFLQLSFAIMVELLVVLLCAIWAVWLTGGKTPLKAGVWVGVVAATLLYIAFEVLTYGVQADAVYIMVSYWSVQLAEEVWMQYTVVVFRVVLVVFGAFCVASEKFKKSGENETQHGQDVLARSRRSPGNSYPNR